MPLGSVHDLLRLLVIHAAADKSSSDQVPGQPLLHPDLNTAKHARCLGTETDACPEPSISFASSTT